MKFFKSSASKEVDKLKGDIRRMEADIGSLMTRLMHSRTECNELRARLRRQAPVSRYDPIYTDVRRNGISAMSPPPPPASPSGMDPMTAAALGYLFASNVDTGQHHHREEPAAAERPAFLSGGGGDFLNGGASDSWEPASAPAPAPSSYEPPPPMSYSGGDSGGGGSSYDSGSSGGGDSGGGGGGGGSD